MLDRNTLIGFSLILALLVGWAYFLKPSDAEIEAYKKQQDSTSIALLNQDSILKKQLDTNKIAASIDTTSANAAILSTFGSFSSFAKGKESFTTLENEELKITFTNKGGRIYKVQLKKYKTYEQKDLILLNGAENKQSFEFPTTENKIINTNDLYFTPTLSENKKSLSLKVNIGKDRKSVV